MSLSVSCLFSSDSSQVTALLRAHELQKAEEEVEAAFGGLGFWVMSFSSIAHSFSSLVECKN